MPDNHYMVNIDRQVKAAAKLVRQGHYFCINRGRQYGKTTTLAVLAERLKDEYCVFNISFEGLGDNSFSCVENACAEFLKILKRSSRVNGASGAIQALLKEVAPVGSKEMNPTDFMNIIDELCGLSPKPLVVLIDEVDQASNNEGFVGFLGVLRNADLLKEENTFFDDMQKKLMQFPKLEDSLRNIIYGGERVAYNFYDKEMNIAAMFNFIKEENGAAKIACRIFETWLYDYLKLSQSFVLYILA